jgi:hypothetical protein
MKELKLFSAEWLAELEGDCVPMAVQVRRKSKNGGRMIPVDRMKIGSKWRKPKSGKKYEIVDFAIDTTTSQCVVIYKKIDVEESDKYTLPIGMFLGDVIVAQTEKYKTYAPRFMPLDEEELKK